MCHYWCDVNSTSVCTLAFFFFSKVECNIGSKLVLYLLCGSSLKKENVLRFIIFFKKLKSIRVLTLVLISFIEKGGHHDLVLAIRYNGYGPLILLWDLFFFGQYYISTKKIDTLLLQSQINLKDCKGNRNLYWPKSQKKLNSGFWVVLVEKMSI